MGNKPQRKWTAVAGAVLLCMAVIFIVFFFGEVSTAKFDSVFLFPTPEYETDWRYYDEAGNAGYEAHQEDGYLVEVEAVSYTHLDVYKRQGYTCVRHMVT